MRNIYFTFFFAFSLCLGFVSCDSDDDVPPKRNSLSGDTNNIYIPKDLFLRYDLDDTTKFYEHGYTVISESRAYRNGYCDTFNLQDSLASFIQVETGVFHDPSTRNGAFYIDFINCIPQGSTEEEIKEIMFDPGEFDYVSNTKRTDGVRIRYYDDKGNLWSTMSGPNSGIYSDFNLSAIIDSPEGDERFGNYIMFGEFSCRLYRGGSTMTITRGRYKMYIGGL